MKNNNTGAGGKVRKCPVCGNTFIPAPYHIYREGHKSNGKLVCSWRCACISEVPKKGKEKCQ